MRVIYIPHKQGGEVLTKIANRERIGHEQTFKPTIHIVIYGVARIDHFSHFSTTI